MSQLIIWQNKFPKKDVTIDYLTKQLVISTDSNSVNNNFIVPNNRNT